MAQYSTGTISISAGTNIVIGNGVDWSDVPIGSILLIEDNLVPFTVATNPGDGTLSLAANLAEAVTSANYVLHWSFSPNVHLPLLDQNALRAADLLTRSLLLIDAALQGGPRYLGQVEEQTATPPGAPADGDMYIVGESATGAWSGMDDQLAAWNGSSWRFTPPEAKDYVFNIDSSGLVFYTGKAWCNWTMTSASLTGSGDNRLVFNEVTSQWEFWIGATLARSIGL